jgi:hypothetical protein
MGRAGANANAAKKRLQERAMFSPTAIPQGDEASTMVREVTGRLADGQAAWRRCRRSAEAFRATMMHCHPASQNPVTETLIVPSGLAQIATETDGAGPVVAFLHAGVADRRMWRGQLAALTGSPSHWRAIAYDRRGFGETLHMEERYSQVGDLLRVLDAVAPREPAILVGCSQGGRIAIDAALAGLFRLDGDAARSRLPSAGRRRSPVPPRSRRGSTSSSTRKRRPIPTASMRSRRTRGSTARLRRRGASAAQCVSCSSR